MATTPLAVVANRRDVVQAVRGVAGLGRSFLGPGTPLKAVVGRDGSTSILVGSPWRLLEHLSDALGTHPAAILLVDSVHALLRQTGTGATWFLALVSALVDHLPVLEDRHGLSPDDALHGLEHALKYLARHGVPALTIPLDDVGGVASGLAHGRTKEMAVAERIAAALGLMDSASGGIRRGSPVGTDHVLVHASTASRFRTGRGVGIGVARVLRRGGDDREDEGALGAMVFPGLALTGRMVSAVPGWKVYWDAICQCARRDEALLEYGDRLVSMHCLCVGTLGDAAEQGVLVDVIRSMVPTRVRVVFCGDAALPTQACLEALAEQEVLLLWGLQRAELQRCDAAFGCRTGVKPSLLTQDCIGESLEAYALLDPKEAGDLGPATVHPNYADPQLQQGAGEGETDGSKLLGTSRERRTFSEPLPVLLRGHHRWVTAVTAAGPVNAGGDPQHVLERVWVCLDRLTAVLGSGRVLPGAGRWEIEAAADLRRAHPGDPCSAVLAEALEAIVSVALENAGVAVHAAWATLASARASAAKGDVPIPPLVPGAFANDPPDRCVDDPRARIYALRQAARLLRLVWGASAAITYRPIVVE